MLAIRCTIPAKHSIALWCLVLRRQSSSRGRQLDEDPGVFKSLDRDRLQKIVSGEAWVTHVTSSRYGVKN